MSDITSLLLEQKELASHLKVIKEKEANLRRQICDELKISEYAVGTHNLTFGNIKVKMKRSLTYSLDQDMVATGLEKGLFADIEVDAIKTKYELGITAYKNIEVPGYLEDCITVKDAMPTLEIEVL